MTKQQVIEALREENKYIRKLCNIARSTHFKINGICFYYDTISRIDLTDHSIDIYDRNNRLAVVIFYWNINRIGI